MPCVIQDKYKNSQTPLFANAVVRRKVNQVGGKIYDFTDIYEGPLRSEWEVCNTLKI